MTPARFVTPSKLGASGKRLFKDISTSFGEGMGESERQILLRAAFIADILDTLEKAIRGDGVFTLVEAQQGQPLTLKVDNALTEYRQQANVLKQLLASLRIPDEAGARSQRRGPRGAYKRTGNVTPIDRARRYGKAAS